MRKVGCRSQIRSRATSNISRDDFSIDANCTIRRRYACMDMDGGAREWKRVREDGVTGMRSLWDAMRVNRVAINDSSTIQHNDISIKY